MFTSIQLENFGAWATIYQYWIIIYIYGLIRYAWVFFRWFTKNNRNVIPALILVGLIYEVFPRHGVLFYCAKHLTKYLTLNFLDCCVTLSLTKWFFFREKHCWGSQSAIIGIWQETVIYNLWSMISFFLEYDYFGS